MTVNELIEALQELRPYERDRQVYVTAHDDDYSGRFSVDGVSLSNGRQSTTVELEVRWWS